jgi:large subunit ribosomal protein L4
MAGETVGEIELLDSVFGASVNQPLMHQALLRQLANARLGTHKTKGRSEVAGGGRKPWKQKGTGRARQGSTRAAQWRGGGIIFGPTPRSYEQRMPKKMRQGAVRSALSVKASDQKIVVLDDLRMAEPKTREMALMLQRLSVDSSALILMPESDLAVEKSANNLPDVKLLRAHYLNVRDLLSYDYVVIPKAALAVIERSGASRGHPRNVLVRDREVKHDACLQRFGAR